MTIDRCYCYQEPFADLKAVADETGAESVAALQAHVTFGENCRLCHPYVRRMLQTGETVFHEVIQETGSDDDPASS
jgi:bacterioferritin-associated ferredoxin